MASFAGCDWPQPAPPAMGAITLATSGACGKSVYSCNEILDMYRRVYKHHKLVRASAVAIRFVKEREGHVDAKSNHQEVDSFFSSGVGAPNRLILAFSTTSRFSLFCARCGQFIFYSDEPMQDLASTPLSLLNESAFSSDKVNSSRFHVGAWFAL